MNRHGTSIGLLLVVMLVALAMSSVSLSHAAYANRFLKLSGKTDVAVSDWNQACIKADKTLAAVRRGERPDGVEFDGNEITYSVPISDVLELHVEAIIRSKNDYEITRWQSVPVGQWIPAESIRVWDGSQIPENEVQ